MNFSALCSILVRFGPVTQEFTLLTITPFAVLYARLCHAFLVIKFFKIVIMQSDSVTVKCHWVQYEINNRHKTAQRSHVMSVVSCLKML